MRLTQFSDYSLRVLLYLGLKQDRATVEELARNFKISRNHLTKVVHQLGRQGYISTSKGKGGGFRLSIRPADVRIGDVVKETEPDLHLVECFDRDHNTCPIQGVCTLENLLHKARTAFFNSLNQMTLEDVLKSAGSSERRRRLNLS